MGPLRPCRILGPGFVGPEHRDNPLQSGNLKIMHNFIEFLFFFFFLRVDLKK